MKSLRVRPFLARIFSGVVFLLGSFPAAATTYYRGELNGWGSSAMAQDNDFGGGNYYMCTITAASNDAPSELKFNNGASLWWGAGTSASKDSTIGTADAAGGGNLSLSAISNTYRYTFRIKDPEGYSLRSYVVMETAADPVAITAVADDHAKDPATNVVTVDIQLSAIPSPQESVWVRYTVDHWTTSKLTVKASGVQTNFKASIPSQPMSTKVEYYVLTSTMPSNVITADFDLCTLRGKKNVTVNYSYRVGGGNSWHYPTNAEPSGAFMRNPPTNGVDPSQNVFFYNGTYTNDNDQTGGTLYHRLAGAGGAWAATNMAWDSNAGGGNQFWVTKIPAGTYAATNRVEYYLAITYNGESTTYLGSTNDIGQVKFLIQTNGRDHPFHFIYGEGGAAANLGNCWHIPTNPEPVTITMRNPATEPATNQDVYIYNGNQYQGSGNPGDQSGGALYYRLVGGGAWSATNLSFDSADGNNKYWMSRIPAGSFARTNQVEYYVKVTYTDHDDTWIGTTNDGAASLTYDLEASAQANPFRFTYSGAEGLSAAWMWHADNRVVSGSNVEFWVKIGYAEGIGSNRWVDYAAIYYTTNGADPQGAYGVATNASTTAHAMSFSHMEGDSYPDGDAMWWLGTLTNLPFFTTVRYRIGSWKTTSGVERFADYGSGTNNQTFAFALGTTGAQVLTVGPLNADYTTTKFFIDEAAGDSEQVVVTYTPGAANLDKVEIFSNLDRRDYTDIDHNSDGWRDGIRPPEGNLITTNDTGAYFRAYPMTPVGGGQYVWTGTVSKCGAYRLTTRYTTNGMAANTWHWYSSAGGRRDHAIVASPKKALEMTMYELNTLTVESTDSTEAQRSTFVDLLGAADGDSDGFDPFNLDYLNAIQANCLWFQPIHPNADTTRGDPYAYVPGSPYATRDYFAVSPHFGTAGTEANAMEEFTNFVAKCDAYTGSVGTVNVMLDGVFNHTAWDAEFGQGGLDLGFCTNADDRIGWFKPTWYAHWQDYGSNATYYHSVYSNDFATAPDRGDFGKWADVTEMYFGKYSALVRHNPDNNGDYLNEDDGYDFAGMVATNEMDLWKYFAYYTEYWLERTGHAGTNSFVPAEDDRGIDGLRCDFGQGLPPQCWEYIINRTRSMKWNFIFMAETLDGGNPGYRSNRHFDVLNENLVFQFTQNHINDSWAVRQALEDRRSSYNGGAILLNLTSHDEVLPDNDCWLVASRYGALSAVDGIPMIFYGQEQGIQNYNPTAWTNDGFRTDHEENFGKYIPHFKQWNQLTVWSNPPPNSDGLAQWYGRVNQARLNSPALQSRERYFLSKVGGGDEGKILAVAKYEQPYASPATSDVVLAFALLFRHGEAHASAGATYNLQGAWSLLGLDTNKLYNVRNLASSDPAAYLWPSNYTGTQIWNDGVYVSLGGGTVNSITNDGELVQYLKLDQFAEPNAAPVISLPSPHTLPVGGSTNFAIAVSDPDGDPVLLNYTLNLPGSVLDGTTFLWTAQVVSVGSTTTVSFVADDQRGEPNSVASSNGTFIVPFDWDGDYMSDGWEWDNFTTLTNAGDGDVDDDGSDNYTESVALTQPTNENSLFEVETIVNSAGQTNYAITASTEPARLYTIQFRDRSLVESGSWSNFGNQADGVGTWAETNTTATTHTFIDDFTTNTTYSPPLQNMRLYRVTVGSP